MDSCFVPINMTIFVDFPVASLLAIGLGRYPVFLTISRIFFLVGGVTSQLVCGLIALETVAIETPASLAISCIVIFSNSDFLLDGPLMHVSVYCKRLHLNTTANL